MRKADLGRVLDYLTRAVTAQDGRVEVEQAHRATLVRICNRLKVGEMLERHLLFTADTFPWRNHFLQQAAQEELGDTLTISQLYAWTGLPRPRGLDPLVRNLVVAAFALISDRAWFSGNAPVSPPPTVEQITASHELRQPRLPAQAVWPGAVQRSASLFGVHTGDLLSAANLATMAAGVRAKARTYVASARDLLTGLQVRAGVLGLDLESPTGRLATARESAALIERLAREHDDVTLAEILAGAHLTAQDTIAARSLSAASEVAAALATAQWSLLEALLDIADHRAEQAQAIISHLRSAATNDEHAQALAPVLAASVAAAAALLANKPVVIPHPRGASHGKATGNLDAVIAALTEAAGAHPTAPIAVSWVIEPVIAP